MKDQLKRRTEDQDKKVGEHEKLAEREGKIKELTEFVTSERAELSQIRKL